MKPCLSMHLVNFAPEPPGDWQRLFDLAAAADQAGIGRLVVSDHVAYGERLDRYADPARGGLEGGRQPIAGTVPVWVSGTVNERSMARLARYGSGWIPWGPDARDMASGIAAMRAAVAAEGRDPAGIDVTGLLPVARDDDGNPRIGASMDAVPGLVEAGVTDLRLSVQPPKGAQAAAEYLAPWVEAFEAAVGA